MRRSTIVAMAGGAIATAGGVWYELTRRGTARDIRLSGVSVALAVVALGVVTAVGGLVVTIAGRRRARRSKVDPVTAWPGQWPTIVVRDHRRRPAPARSANAAVTTPR
jgi:hypothetical protein